MVANCWLQQLAEVQRVASEFGFHPQERVESEDKLEFVGLTINGSIVAGSAPLAFDVVGILRRIIYQPMGLRDLEDLPKAGMHTSSLRKPLIKAPLERGIYTLRIRGSSPIVALYTRKREGGDDEAFAALQSVVSDMTTRVIDVAHQTVLTGMPGEE